jgi:hypothetical protein
MTTGILYIAIGERWCREASVAAANVKQYMPHLPITLLADRAWRAPAIDVVQVLTPDANPLLTKTRWMAFSPYARTLFLDTDVTLCDNVAELFGLLDRFDLAVPHAPCRLENMGMPSPLPDFLAGDVPACFPGMNTGLLLFKQSAPVTDFLVRWGEYHTQHCMLMPKAPNQPAFRAALYRSDLRFAIVPEEYHCRFICPFKVTGRVKVLHGRHPDMELVARRLNQSELPRIGEGYLVELARQRRQRRGWRRIVRKADGLLRRVGLGPLRSVQEPDEAAVANTSLKAPPDGIPYGGIVSLL